MSEAFEDLLRRVEFGPAEAERQSRESEITRLLQSDATFSALVRMAAHAAVGFESNATHRYAAEKGAAHLLYSILNDYHSRAGLMQMLEGNSPPIWPVSIKTGDIA